jgi:hypothetical protein
VHVTKVVAKILGALLATAAGIVLALDGADVIQASTRVVVTCIVVSAALAAVTTIASAWHEWRSRRLGRQRDLVEIVLNAAAWAVVDQVGPPLDYRDLGIAAYRTERSRWRPWRTVLRRVHRVRASRRAVSSDVDWRPGKGVIGTCVSKGEVVAVDMAQLYADLGQPSATEWAQVPEDTRLGLSYDEYLDLRDKYAVVVATPIIDDRGPRSRVAGCVALDGPEGRLDQLASDEVLGLLNFAGRALLQQAG